MKRLLACLLLIGCGDAKEPNYTAQDYADWLASQCNYKLTVKVNYKHLPEGKLGVCEQDEQGKRIWISPKAWHRDVNHAVVFAHEIAHCERNAQHGDNALMSPTVANLDYHTTIQQLCQILNAPHTFQNTLY